MFVRWNSTAVLLLVSACFLFGTVALYFDGVTSIKRQAIWKEVPSLWFSRQESGVKKIATYEQDEILNTTASTEPQFASFRFRRRIGHLRRVCEEGEKQGIWDRVEKDRRATNYVQNDNFLVLPDHNFLMCVLPKCGSSSWHWLVRDMRDPLSVGHAFGWQDRQKNTQMSQDLLPEDGDRLMQNGDAFRGISVRHPFGKLVSGWNDKLARGTTYGGFLLEAYPHMQEYASEKDKLHILSFEDFVEYIATYGDNVENLDYHFLPMEYLCQPCLYPYNYIIKIESLGNDQNWLTGELKVTNMPWQQKGQGYFNATQANPVQILRSYFKNVRKETILKLLDIYYYDFVLFGYSFDVDTLTAGGMD